MGAAVYSFQVNMVSAGACITCGVEICMPQHLMTELQRNHRNFYCVNGHSQHWPGKSDLELAQEQLARQKEATERERRYREQAERSAAAARGQVTKIKNRVGNGVCPCCNRTFQNLMRHMQSKHPEFKDAEP